MNRVFLSRKDAEKYFELIKSQEDLSYFELARLWKINPRTLRDWKNGQYSFPEELSRKVEQRYKIPLPQAAMIENDSDIKARAGKIGAVERMKKYGNPGTPLGRSKGGKISLLTHQKNNNGFKIAKLFPTPQKTSLLAEFIGIMLGDGGLTDYQTRITLNKIDDMDYVDYVKEIANKLFLEYPSLSSGRGKAIDLVISGKNLVDFLISMGLVKGDKIKQKIHIPSWINNRNEWKLSVLRGLFDTDGSVYLDKHYKKNIVYKSICVAYTSYSAPLQSNIYDLLVEFGFFPTISTINRIMLRKKEEVMKFFELVKPGNGKHVGRYRQYLEA
ncbi:hypothetical protein A2Z00_01320 [Candidatus Gottesmanbacteria bacterium RBG_13_45_10]|uniref:DOD-type homing endonuclease domain-containing protein n=1 Tax=Candidatus Gottesmanbacteria bacterium RBG_13_45_10 TaxID=1798370 RepID=A0A1F5ZHZ6_9BACT|nr:MAG: hypothetical protein A2Z00_01320 [Candidatus Gottesmanbacteria bacterium RBG_13_45_10]